MTNFNSRRGMKPYDKDVAELKNIKQVNSARRLVGLSPLVKRIRECLHCKDKFKSISDNNRLCPTCRLLT